MNIVWIKKDCRVSDHPALLEASKKGPCVAVYVVEPDLWKQPDMSWRHYFFLKGALSSLHKHLAKRGIGLLIRKGSITAVLDQLLHQFKQISLFSNEETGNNWTYQRDKAVRKWANFRGVTWQEFPQNGVIRRLKDRDGWAKKWAFFMTQKIEDVLPQTPISSTQESFTFPSATKLGLVTETGHEFQQGGEDHALTKLTSFLNERGEHYSKEMSSPVTAYDSCTRLSPYLSFGCISMRQMYQLMKQKQDHIKKLPRPQRGGWAFSLQACLGRLRWHCHFIQKLEDEPSMEYQSLHSAYRHLDMYDYHEQVYQLWKEGKTGFPLVDACMRSLKVTGWLNFRMRAMIVSVGCHHLQLPWKVVAHHLATQFTDYEPGIHYSQCQMQAGVTGMNAIRIYNPIKQGYDHDPEGIFIKKWVPELVGLPKEHVCEPWAFDWNIAPPIVDEKISRQNAAKRLYQIRKTLDTKAETMSLLSKHGSRRKLHIKRSKNR